jgi:methylthioribulose-1-phosphate dehydratase
MSQPLTKELVESSARALLETISRVYARGWCEATSGNYSVTVRHDPLVLLITRSGIDKGRIVPEDLLAIGQDGAPIGGRAERPSAETALHLTLVRETGAAAILHTHSVWGTLLGEQFVEQRGFTVSGYEMLKGIEGVGSHRDGVWVPVLRNTQNMEGLADAVRHLLQRRTGVSGFLIAGHGLYTWGGSLEQAYRHVEAFEFLFQLVGRRTRFERFE